jgi:hypothetical protein
MRSDQWPNQTLQRTPDFDRDCKRTLSLAGSLRTWNVPRLGSLDRMKTHFLLLLAACFLFYETIHHSTEEVSEFVVTV